MKEAEGNTKEEFSIPPDTLCYHGLKTISDVVNDSNLADITLRFEKGIDISEFYERIKNGLELRYGKPILTDLADVFTDEAATIHFYKHNSYEKDSALINIVLDKKIKEEDKSKILADCIKGVNEIIIECAEYYQVKLVCDEMELKSVYDDENAFKTPKLFLN